MVRIVSFVNSSGRDGESIPGPSSLVAGLVDQPC